MEVHNPEECAAAGRALAIAVALATLKAIGDAAEEMSRKPAAAGISIKTKNRGAGCDESENPGDEVRDNR